MLYLYDRESSITDAEKNKRDEVERLKESSLKPETSSVTFQDQMSGGNLEKSKSDSKLNQVSLKFYLA